ncbi:MAG: hypothetical protein QFB87_01100 [Patescibacteria group bacterium]|nr:hypothetical protein [Patescibacteria group bacterium]
MKKSFARERVTSNPTQPVYFFGLVGSLVYYIQVSQGFWSVVVAFLKAIVWPAFLTHDLLKFIAT